MLVVFLWAPLGQADPVQTVDLSGTWGFTPQGGSPTTIQVPGGGWYKQGYTGTYGIGAPNGINAPIIDSSIDYGDYETNITIPNIGQPQTTILEFGVVNYQADLYINNVLVGSSIQAWTPCTFDISAYVVPGGTYNIRVHVLGRDSFFTQPDPVNSPWWWASLVPQGSGWCPWGAQGIFRSAKLKVYPQVYISDVFVRPSVAHDALYYQVSVHNGSASSTNVNIAGDLTSWNGDSWNYPALPVQALSVPANSTATTLVGPVTWGLGSASYWWPNVPYQSGYTAKLHYLNLAILSQGGNVVMDQKSTRFGFRESTQGPDGNGNTVYFLNGIRVNYRGDSMQPFDYDSVNYAGGQSDAVDTLPGFLPPSPGNPGWPQAVDNYERLNYNFVRIHQQPWTPYMMDVCDEMGLMVMVEPAYRGSDSDQNWIDGLTNFTNHLAALLTRDRNHPSVVRVSQNNENNFSYFDSVSFESKLFQICMDVGLQSWPVSDDCGNTAPSYLDQVPYAYNQAYGLPDLANWATYSHYNGNGALGAYTEAVFARSDMPYGQGEFIWFADNTKQGFTWFGTSTEAMRAQGASDIRPYALLSAWASLIPGVASTNMYIENGFPRYGKSPYSLYGADNLSDPWSNPQFQRVQAGFNPVLVADRDYWSLQKLSDANGNWPSTPDLINGCAPLTRTLDIFNDTFSGTSVDVFWEFHQGSPAGPILDSGGFNANVPLGYMVTNQITIQVPESTVGTEFYPVMWTEKNGVEMFREQSEKLTVFNQVQLTGTPFGTAPYSVGNEFDKAFDGNLNTFFDAAVASGGYTGIDLGAGNEQYISSITFSPRPGFEFRMVGGQFQGSVDGVNYTTLYTIQDTPAANTTVVVNSYRPYRYLRYVGPDNGYCDVAEIAFKAEPVVSAQQLSGTPFGSSPSYEPGAEFDKVFDGDLNTFFDYSQPDGGYAGIDLGAGNAKRVGYVAFTPRADSGGYTLGPSRMVGGQFQGSTDGVTYTTFYTIANTPPAGTSMVAVACPEAYRYLRYLSPNGSYGNVAEIAFFAPQIVSSGRLAGTPFGTSPSYSPGNEFDKAFDGDINTFFDYSQPDGGYTGIDLGAGNARKIGFITYTPRPGFEFRMTGGQFQGSTDGVNYTTFYTITSQPSGTTTVAANTSVAYRYLRYLSPNGSYGDVAEIWFFPANDNVLHGTAFGTSPPYSAGSEFDKAGDGDKSTFFDYSQPSGGYAGIDLGANNSQQVSYVVFTPRADINGYNLGESRMVGGQFQGSTDGINYTTLYTISNTPSANQNNTTVFINSPDTYRYLRYLGPDNSYCDVAEVAYHAGTPTVDTTAPVITLNGDAVMILQCGDTYTEPGATVADACDPDLSAVIGGDTVDNHALGTYVITYNATDDDGNAALQVTRTVQVVDTTPPVITVTGLNPVTNECHTAYSDAGATALDTCAGPVSVQTSGTVDANTPGVYTLTYTAGDGNGNTNTATRTVVVRDSLAPVITLNGNASMLLCAGSSYVEPGATATDNCAGDLSSLIVISGTVNTAVSGTYLVHYNVSDPSGNAAAEQIRTVVVNEPPIVSHGGPYTVNEGSTVTLTGSATDVDDPQASLSYAWDLDNNGTFETPGASVTFDATLLDGPSTYTVGLKVTDGRGCSTIVQTTVQVLNVAPTVTGVSAVGATVNPIALGGTATLAVSFSDPGKPDTHQVLLDWGDGITTTNALGTNVYSVNVSHTYTQPGVYQVNATVIDDDGGIGTNVYKYIVVYDPSGGFVTGGGTIQSPAGAYTANPALTGQASFGFNAKYQKGANVPDGETEFNFSVASFNFHSTSYDWLVVSGTSKAQYKGSGTVNGTGNYKFLLSAIDGSSQGNGNFPDKFRIKIWDAATGTVVYDNNLGADDNADPTTVISGGNIVVHTK